VIRQNVDKHYLAALEKKGIAIVPSDFAEPGEDAGAARHGLPCRSTRRRPTSWSSPRSAPARATRSATGRGQKRSAQAHVKRLLAEGRSVLMQPYLDSVDEAGETALIFFDWRIQPRHPQGPAAGRRRGLRPRPCSRPRRSARASRARTSWRWPGPR
jgi:O-ureido-D-serine cyclo-ligase